jgi:hypothetical protein
MRETNKAQILHRLCRQRPPVWTGGVLPALFFHRAGAFVGDMIMCLSKSLTTYTQLWDEVSDQTVSRSGRCAAPRLQTLAAQKRDYLRNRIATGHVIVRTIRQAFGA